MTINNTQFTQNSAEEGGALNNQFVTYIENSKFTDESDIIYNNGNIVLNNNTKSKGILVNNSNNLGNIYSPTNIILIDGKNKIIPDLNENIALYGTLTDDMGNAIYDSDYKITVNNVELETSYNATENLYHAIFTPSKYGEYAVNTPCVYINTTINTGKCIVTKKGTYSNLQLLIDNSADELNLEYNFTYDTEFDTGNFTDGVKINKSIIINGDGFTISGNNTYRIFNIIKDNEVILDNISFIKGNGESGGAIYTKANLTITNCEFSQNTAKEGGAVYNYGELLITNTNFTQNNATTGGALKNYGKITIKNANFTQNNVKNFGGAIYNDQDTIIIMTETKFIQNTANLGGAIYGFYQGNLTVNDSNFINNTAEHGGAIHNYGYLTINKSNFTQNQATVYQGGAINFEGTVNIVIDGCRFTQNKAEHGGAIYNKEGSITITNSEFAKNNADTGGAIYNLASIIINNTEFTQNNASNAKVMWNLGNGIIEDSQFTHAASDNIYIIDDRENHNLILINSKFNDEGDIIRNLGTISLINNTKENGYIILDSGTIKSLVKTTLINGENITRYTLKELRPYATLTDDNGNTIFIASGRYKITVNGTELTTSFNQTSNLYTAKFTPTAYGEYNISTTFTTDNITVTNGKYTIKSFKKGSYTDLQQLINNCSGELILPYNFTYDSEFDDKNFPNGVIINKAITINGNGYTINGENSYRIFNVAADGVILDNITFKNGYCKYEGGAINNNGNLTVKNSQFINNKADVDGGAIYNNGNLTVEKSQFINNKVYYEGGAINNNGNLTVTNTNFTQNNATKGGAIANTKELLITDCKFTENCVIPKYGQGGAIYNVANFTVSNTNFTQNNAIHGGSINNEGGTFTVNNSQFSKNKANYGGAIYSKGANNITVSNSIFTENNGTVNSGAICNVVKSELTLINSKFTVESDFIENGNGSKVKLKNNTKENGILIKNSGIILSEVKAVLMNGENLTVIINSTVYPYATLTDDNGNLIYDSNFQILINNTEFETDYDTEANIYNTTFTPENNGEAIVNTSYTSANLTVTTGKYTINPANLTEFKVEVENITKGKNAIVYVTVKGIEGIGVTCNVELLINNTKYTINVINGKGNKTIENLKTGTYTVNATFKETKYYYANKTTTTFTVKDYTKLNITVENITKGQNATLFVTVTDTEDTGINCEVELLINNTKYTINVANGKGNKTIENLKTGTYTVNATFKETNYYYGSIASAVFHVKDISNLTVECEETIEYGASATVNIKLTDSNGVGINGTVIITVDDKEYSAEIINGSGNKTLTGLGVGNHNITVNYPENENYTSASTSVNIKVYTSVYKITNNKDVSVRYLNTLTYKVLITKDGKAVGASEKVTVKFNGKTYTVKTDSKGYATFKLAMKIKPKSYTITATYKGVTVKNTVKVKHIIKAKNKKVKKSKKVTKVKIKLYKVNGKKLANKKIKIKFKGKTYKVKTNKKGVAKWKVKKSMVKKLKVGKKYKYIVAYGKDKVTKKIKIKK